MWVFMNCVDILFPEQSIIYNNHSNFIILP